jgi:NAD(P)-dependent dehydrogenase (short-subunit alcohol dehydrogenase family)
VSRVHYDLRGKTVLITGGAGGIGSETARQLVAVGANIALLDVHHERLEQVAKELGGRAWGRPAGVTSSADLEAAVAGTVERFGGIDVVVANAATFALGRIESLARCQGDSACAPGRTRTSDTSLEGPLDLAKVLAKSPAESSPPCRFPGRSSDALVESASSRSSAYRSFDHHSQPRIWQR